MKIPAFIFRLFALSTSSNKLVAAHAPKKQSRPLDFGWASPHAEEAKLQILSQQLGREVSWGEEVSTYLYYYVGDIAQLSDEDISSLEQILFVREAKFGDIELHRSVNLPGRSMYVRLRGVLRLTPAIFLQGRYCPLYQYAHDGGPFEGPQKGMCNFFAVWNPIV